MNKFILGSGIVGLLARHILGPEWKIIPFKKSRFYSYSPALADDFIVQTPEVNDTLASLGLIPQNRRYLRAFSYSGELIFSEQSFAKQLYVQKLYGSLAHPAANALIKTDFLVSRTSVGDLYDKLTETYEKEISEATNVYGEVETISDHHIKTNKTELDFSKLVSTIPLEALHSYRGQNIQLPGIDVWYYLVKTTVLNFEGANDVLVVDQPFDFFKVSHVAPKHYLFHCLMDLGNPKQYLGAFLNNNLEVTNHTAITKAIPVGVPPKLDVLEAADIFPVGSHAQWDTFMDVSSSIRRLHKLR